MGLAEIALFTVAVLVISFLLSMVGLGGGQLYMPLFFLLGMDLKAEAIPVALMLNFLTVLSATGTYWRKKLIAIKEVIPFVVAITLFPFIGAYLTGIVPDRLILLIFALILIIVAAQIFIKKKTGYLIKSKRAKFFVGIIAGAILGIMVGMLGRGAGSFIVPILLLMDFDPKMAIGTASLINCISSFTGFLGNLNLTMFGWHLIPYALASIIGSQVGSRLMVKKLKAEAVKKIFAIIIGLVGILMILNLLLR